MLAGSDGARGRDGLGNHAVWPGTRSRISSHRRGWIKVDPSRGPSMVLFEPALDKSRELVERLFGIVAFGGDLEHGALARGQHH